MQRLATSLLVAALSVAVVAGAAPDPRDDDDAAPHPVDTTGMGAPRVSVDRPVEFVPLLERNRRIWRLPSFQALVDAAPAGSILVPPPGAYAGPVLVTKSLVIDGRGKVTIDGGDKGTVFVLQADHAVLRGLHLQGSGESHDSDDACLNLRGNHDVIDGLTLDNCLFGIDLKQANDNLITHNRVRSKPAELGMRGDGIRLWYSMRNRVESNEVTDSRDTVVWYSSDNVFRSNIGRRNRYSMHFMFSHRNEVLDNRFYDNAVGVYLMYTEGTNLRRNVISHAMGSAGMAIGFKEASDSIVEDNELIYCAIGIGSDVSPFQPDTTIQIRRNHIAYNGIAVLLTTALGGTIVTGNTFEGNLTNVAVGARSATNANVWRGNYWDDYEGFDRNHDSVGDRPYDLYAYADRIWMDFPAARFFATSPALELLDFLERLAPFTSPDRLVRDDSPRFTRPGGVRR